MVKQRLYLRDRDMAPMVKGLTLRAPRDSKKLSWHSKMNYSASARCYQVNEFQNLSQLLKITLNQIFHSLISRTLPASLKMLIKKILLLVLLTQAQTVSFPIAPLLMARLCLFLKIMISPLFSHISTIFLTRSNRIKSRRALLFKTARLSKVWQLL